jgi:hypothetical protein
MFSGKCQTPGATTHEGGCKQDSLKANEKDKRRRLGDLHGFSAGPGAAAQFDFALDLTNGFRRDADKLDTNAYTWQAIADLAPRLNFGSGKRQTKLQIAHCAFGKTGGGVKKHSASAHVGRTSGNLFGMTFVMDRDVLNGVNAGGGSCAQAFPKKVA